MTFIDVRNVNDLLININIDTTEFVNDIDLVLKEMELRIKQTFKKVFGDGGGEWGWSLQFDLSNVKSVLIKAKKGIDSGLKDFIVKVVNEAKASMLFYLGKSGAQDVIYSGEKGTIVLPRLTTSYQTKKRRLGRSSSLLQFTGVTRAAVQATPVTVVDVGGGLRISWNIGSDKFNTFNLGRSGQVPRPAMSIFKAEVESRLARGFKTLNEAKFTSVEDIERTVRSL